MKVAFVIALISVVAATGCARRADAPAGAPASIEGRVSLGPQCPVERAGSPCPTTPPANTPVWATPRGGRGSDPRATVRTTTRPDGTFQLSVAPGTYVVSASAGMRCTPVDATVDANQTSRIRITCDTGIR